MTIKKLLIELNKDGRDQFGALNLDRKLVVSNRYRSPGLDSISRIKPLIQTSLTHYCFQKNILTVRASKLEIHRTFRGILFSRFGISRSLSETQKKKFDISNINLSIKVQLDDTFSMYYVLNYN